MKLKALPLGRLALFFSVLTASHAAVVIYTSPAAWQSAVPSVLNVSFANAVRPGDFNIYGTGGGADIIDDVGFSAGSGYLVFVSQSYFSPRYVDCDVACVQNESLSHGSITISAAGSTAIGFYYFWPLSGSATLDVTIGSFVYDTTQSSDDVEFLGFVSSTPFNTVTISSNETPNIFDVSIGPDPEAPEPGASALAVFGLATLGLYFVRRRRGTGIY